MSEEPDIKEVFKQAIRSDFSMKEWGFDNFVGIGIQIIEEREIYQKLIGKLAYSLTVVKGNHALPKFAQALEEATGRKMSPETLRHYRWIYSKVGHLNIPEDISFSVWSSLASTENPEEWLKKTIDNGWSGAELKREIRISQGKDPVHRIHHCPYCNKDF